MNSERYMPSVFPECDKLKQSYDKCFTVFFQQYVNSDHRIRNLENPCEDLLKVYKRCVDEVRSPGLDLTFQRLKHHRPFDIDLEEVQKEILNSRTDSFQRS